MRQAWTLLTNGFDADAAPRRHHAVSPPHPAVRAAVIDDLKELH